MPFSVGGAGILAIETVCLCRCFNGHPPQACGAFLSICHFVSGYPCPIRAADPNEKEGPVGSGPQGFVSVQQASSYTIDFENVPSATAAAQRIRITDQLDPALDARTLRLKEIGFSNYRIVIPENRAFYQTRIQLGEDFGNLLADIVAGMDIASGRVTWTLTAIDPK